MPIAIEDYDLIAGRSLLNGQIVRCNLPMFLKPSELGECNVHMSHKCPDYETLLSQGISRIISRLEEKEKTPSGIQDPDERKEKKDFIEGVRIEAEALLQWQDAMENWQIQGGRGIRRKPEGPLAGNGPYLQ